MDAEADQAVWTSAGQTGGGKRLRFVTNSDCQLDVARVTLTPVGDDSFSQMRTELVAQGFTRADRKYLVWVDAAVGICGLGEVYGDTRPGPENRNNRGPSYTWPPTGTRPTPASSRTMTPPARPS